MRLIRLPFCPNTTQGGSPRFSEISTLRYEETFSFSERPFWGTIISLFRDLCECECECIMVYLYTYKLRFFRLIPITLYTPHTHIKNTFWHILFEKDSTANARLYYCQTECAQFYLETSKGNEPRNWDVRIPEFVIAMRLLYVYIYLCQKLWDDCIAGKFLLWSG